MYFTYTCTVHKVFLICCNLLATSRRRFTRGSLSLSHRARRPPGHGREGSTAPGSPGVSSSSLASLVTPRNVAKRKHGRPVARRHAPLVGDVAGQKKRHLGTRPLRAGTCTLSATPPPQRQPEKKPCSAICGRALVPLVQDRPECKQATEKSQS